MEKNRRNDVVRVVIDYVAEANFYAGFLFHLAGGLHPLSAWHLGRLPRRWADRQMKRTFSMHGKGCTVGPKQHAINFDFSATGRAAEVDPNKVYDYASARPKLYGQLPPRKAFVALFETWSISEGLVATAHVDRERAG